jgi:hypothetical protein
VAYAPKKMITNGLFKSPRHVLHYALVPDGTLECHYSDDEIGNRRMSRPEANLGAKVPGVSDQGAELRWNVDRRLTWNLPRGR